MKLFVIFFSVLLITESLYSQNYNKNLVNNYISLGAGITLPSGVFSNIGKSGYNILLNYTDILSDVVAVRSETSYHFIPFKKKPTDNTYHILTIKGDILIGMFSSKSQFKPYGYAGVGYYDFATPEYNIIDPYYGNSITIRKSNTGYIGFDIGVGSLYAISPKFVMYAEADYNLTFSKDNPINHIPFKVGLMFGI
ncbi:MAG: hypothetical protein WC358_08355 [Ignavibacteria bacterium]|jgi:hypothetical protein